MNNIAIHHGRIIDPANGIDSNGSLFISDGKVAGLLKQPDGFTADRVIDATDCIVSPGFIDLSARLREPGQTRKASFASETKAAAAAGITTLCLPPDTQPAIDTTAVAESIKELAKKNAYPNILPIAALTQKLEGAELSNMLSLKQTGCCAVSNANQPIKNLLTLRRAMEYAASHDLLLIYRPNEPSLSLNGCMHEGKLSTRYGLPSIPDAAETIALMQCLELAELTGCRVHFSQISSARAITKLRQAKTAGLLVSADAAAHQLHLTEDDIIPFDSAFHVQPPLRTHADRDALREGLADGTLDCLCSDHQPHDLDAKLGAFPETEAGISTLETVLPLMLRLVEEQAITLPQGIASLTHKPAAILNIDKGNLAPGSAADVCIFNPEQNWRVDADTWLSQGVNTPFWQHRLKGRVTCTLQNGVTIYSADQ